MLVQAKIQQLKMSRDLLVKIMMVVGILATSRIPVRSQTYTFARLTGTPLNTAGWNLQGDAHVANITGTGNAELLLCSIRGASGAAFFNQPINLSMCSKWKAEFDFRMYDGTGADGLAFCFLDVPPAGFVTGSGLGIPSSANGLKVCFDTWNNCLPFNASTVHYDMPKIEIRWGIGYDRPDPSNPGNSIMGECLSEPTRDNYDGKLNFIRSPNYNHALITYDSGRIQVYVNDTLYLSGFQQFNFTGYLGFTASTGGYNDNHSIKNVVIYTDMPPSVAGGSRSFCPQDTVHLGGAPNPTYRYSWYPSQGLSDTASAAPVLQLSNTTGNILPRTYYIKTSFASNPGCASVDSVQVQVYPNPIPNMITPEICLTDAKAQFYDSSYTHDSTMLPFTYLWNFGDSTAGAGNPNFSVQQNPTHIYHAADNYLLGLRVTSARGCTDSITRLFTVNGAVPRAAFRVNNSAALCSNQAVELTNRSTVDFGSITKTVIFWGDPASVSDTDNHPFPGKIYRHDYPNPVSGGITTYTIKMLAYSGISCQSEYDTLVSVQPSPHVRFTAVSPVCDNQSSFQLTQATEISGIPGTFVFQGTGLTPGGVFNPEAGGAGSYQLLYKYTGANGCSDSAYQTLQVIASPLVNAGADFSVLQGASATLQARASGSNLAYLWKPAVFLNNDSILQPVSTPLQDIRYTLTVTGTGGCQNSSAVFIKVLLPPLIPNAFSPNGDGINDKWEIRYLDSYPNCDVKIFNRYGQLLFHSVGYNQPWDGTYNGKPLPSGTYYYLIDTKRYKQPFAGPILIIR